jgi:hypothetical protein
VSAKVVHEKAVYRKKPPCRWVRTGKKRGHRGFRRDCGGRGVWVQIKDRDTEEADREHHQSLTRAFGFE